MRRAWLGLSTGVVLWTGLVGVFLLYDLRQIDDLAAQLARTDAEAVLNGDLAYRQWVALLGGVYVEPSDATPPNPYLADLPGRDVTTTDGRRLTLVNPDYMVRLVHELGGRDHGARGHITSLTPIRPQNVPDPWERGALESLARGATEVYSVETLDGDGYLRCMHPLVTGKSCLKCHGAQGYQVGDTHGGISVSVPLAPYLDAQGQVLKGEALTLSVVWLGGIGLLGLIAGMRHRRAHEREAAEAALARERALLRTFIDHLPCGVYAKDMEHRFILANRLTFTAEGFSSEAEILGKTDHDLYPPDQADRFRREEAGILTGEGGGFLQRDGVTVGPDGAPRFWFSTKVALRAESGAIVGLVGISHPVTELRQALEAVQATEERYRRIVEMASEGISSMDRDHLVTFVNPRMAAIVGYEPNEMVGQPIDRFVFEEDLEESRTRAAQRARGKHSDTYECRFRRKDGSTCWCLASATALEDENGEFAGSFAMFTDITERRRAQDSLRRERDFSTSVLQTIASLAVVLDPQGRVVVFNRACEQCTGYTADEALGRPLWEFLLPEEMPGVRVVFDSLLFEALPSQYENYWVAKDGSRRLIAWSNSVLRDSEGNVEYVLGTGIDVTDLRRAERAIRSITLGGSATVGERFFDTMAMQPAAALGADYTFIGELAGPSMVRTVSVCAHGEIADGLEYHLAGTPCENVVDREPRAYPRGVADRFPADTLLRDMGVEGYVFTPLFDSQGNALGIMVALYCAPLSDSEMDLARKVLQTFSGRTAAEIERRHADLERRRLEDRVQQAQRLESLGVLAAGIAHDFNNILGAIMGYTELSLGLEANDPTLRGNLQRVLAATERARDLIQQILTFTRKAPSELRPLSLAPVVREALRFMRSSLPATIEIRQHLDPECGAALADATQVHQVIMNLCTNAQHAMREAGGVLDVRLEPFRVNGGEPAPGGLARGDYVRLTVSDTGCGMDEETRRRVFDPFFTTKRHGEGTGLGLAVVHGIVAGHGGAITAYSEPGRGSTFRVYLPCTADVVVDDSDGSAPPPRGDERVLVVDDEEVLALMLQRMLTSLGYAVAAHTSSSGALAAFLAAPDSIDIVVTDHTMPGMTGIELAKRIKEVRGDVGVLLLTGFAHLVDPSRLREQGLDAFLMKPYTIHQLADAVRAALSGATSTNGM